ncbi:hypothetical protein PIB30_008907 [Stylosanthes scabra]|uniref:Reverse transcriptase zinc-binding domain-containing protein n=1 Tax=Stylosanthes scabra TaxID=79078 RepID=A0ABU6Q659_9FABA|nr:hypothetical protein [Stylosanthes scabra]
MSKSENKQVYDGVWNDRVPPRFELLCWFAINGGLATKDKLVKRKILQPLCSMRLRSIKEWFEMWLTQEVVRSKRRSWDVLFFAVVWVIWRCRNVKVFENKTISASNSWEMVKALVNSWGKVEKRKPIACGTQGKHEIVRQWIWWNCLMYRPEMNGIVIGGYLTNKLDVVCCMKGEFIAVDNMDEATLICLEGGVQFILQEANLVKNEVTNCGVLQQRHREVIVWREGYCLG